MDNNGGGGSGGEIRHPMAAERSPLALAVEQSSNRFTVHDMATTGVVPGSSGNSSGSNVLGTINKTTNHQGEKWKWKKKSLGSSCRTELSQLSPPSSLLFIVANSGLLFLLPLCLCPLFICYLQNCRNSQRLLFHAPPLSSQLL